VASCPLPDPVVSAPPPGQTNADLAVSVLRRALQAVVGCQAEVLKDREREPLHQMRVALRRLATAADQFAPALVLPDSCEAVRIAKIGRRLGLVRDLDVLRLQLEDRWQPLLPERDQRSLRPVFKRLRRERRLAFEDLQDTLRSRRYLKVLADLQGWLKHPELTGLGEQPLAVWLPEWRAAALQGLWREAGWWQLSADGDGAMAALHRLRRRLKRARYGLQNLEGADPMPLAGWVDQFKAMQASLGDLNDLVVLQRAIADQLDGSFDQQAPTLASLLLEAQLKAWLRWQQQRAALLEPSKRLQLQALLADSLTHS
jgi:CHAD domain-containing protein